MCERLPEQLLERRIWRQPAFGMRYGIARLLGREARGAQGRLRIASFRSALFGALDLLLFEGELG